MNQADHTEIGVFEQTLHDPHNIGQNVRFRIEARHHERHIGGTLVIGNDQRANVLLAARRQIIADFNDLIPK